jgi:hypothetical protein
MFCEKVRESSALLCHIYLWIGNRLSKYKFLARKIEIVIDGTVHIMAVRFTG